MRAAVELIAVGVDVTSIEHLATVRRRNARAPLSADLCGEALRHADPFLARFTAPAELDRPLSDADVARLWTGKEAVAKALGTGFWQRGVGWDDIRVDPVGAVAFAGAARALAGPDRFAVDFVVDGDLMVAMAWRWRRRG